MKLAQYLFGNGNQTLILTDTFLCVLHSAHRGDSSTRRFLSPTRRVAHTFDWPWNQKTNPDRHPPLCTPLKPSGRQLLCCGFSTWSLLGHNPNLNPHPTPDPIYHNNSKTDPEPRMCPHVTLHGFTTLVSLWLWQCPWTEP